MHNKISVFAMFEGDILETGEDMGLQSHEVLQMYGGGKVCAPHYTNVCKISRLFLSISSPVSEISTSNVANLLILLCTFHWFRWIFAMYCASKVEKNCGRVSFDYYTLMVR